MSSHYVRSGQFIKRVIFNIMIFNINFLFLTISGDIMSWVILINQGILVFTSTSKSLEGVITLHVDYTQ